MLGNSRGRIGGPRRVKFQTLARARELATRTYREATSSTRIGYSVRQAASTIVTAAAESPEQRNGGNGGAGAHGVNNEIVEHVLLNSDVISFASTTYIKYYILSSMGVGDGQARAEIAWEGDSKEVISGFPAVVKSTFGFSLRQIQNGRVPRCEHRPMPSVGKGVWELKDGDERAWYRVMYLARIGNLIHVLHCFEKSSRKTDRRDLDVAKARLKVVMGRLREHHQESPSGRQLRRIK